MNGPDLGRLGEGWTASTTYSIGSEMHGGFVRRVQRALVTYRHELGGRAVAVHHRPLNSGDWTLVEARAGVMCIDQACTRTRGFQHALGDMTRISGDELRLLTTDEVALTL